MKLDIFVLFIDIMALNYLFRQARMKTPKGALKFQEIRVFYENLNS